MEFALSETQIMLEASLRRLLSETLPMERRRAVAGTGSGRDVELDAALLSQGVGGLLVPERHDGSGLGLLDAAVVAESLGYHAAPSALAGQLVMAPLALQASATDAQQAEWLPKIARGDVRLAVGFADGAGQTGRAHLSLDGALLSGEIDGLVDGAGATGVLLYLPDGRAAVVEAGALGVTLETVASLDRLRPLSRLRIERAPAELLGAANDPLAAMTRVRDAGRVVMAADTLGAAQSMLDQAVAYAKERVQFGRVIGSFQGVKHTLADMVTMLEPCRSLVWFAAYAQDHRPDEARLVALQAKAHLDEIGREVARLSTEVHGGMGFTDLLGLHYWYKRIAANRHILGAPERLRHEAAQVQGWTR